ncbi:MAG: spore germination protein GerW family protein [Azospirillaceae bacterium]|nr:spore germination protein GerW family protein [Azospirillaceae bacterium]
MTFLNPFTVDPTKAYTQDLMEEFRKAFDQGTLGDPITIDGTTIMTVNLVTFGVGTYGGTAWGEGVGGGGGGGSIPCAIIVVREGKVEIHKMPDELTKSAAEKVTQMVTQMRGPHGKTETVVSTDQAEVKQSETVVS